MTRQRSSATLTDAESLASTIISETSLRLSARLRTYGRLDEVPISVTVMVPLSFAFSLYATSPFTPTCVVTVSSLRAIVIIESEAKPVMILPFSTKFTFFGS